MGAVEEGERGVGGRRRFVVVSRGSSLAFLRVCVTPSLGADVFGYSVFAHFGLVDSFPLRFFFLFLFLF